MEELRSRFCRALEAEFMARSAAHHRRGTSQDAAHEQACREVEELGGRALAELQRRGMFQVDAVARQVCSIAAGQCLDGGSDHGNRRQSDLDRPDR